MALDYARDLLRTAAAGTTKGGLGAFRSELDRAQEQLATDPDGARAHVDAVLEALEQLGLPGSHSVDMLDVFFAQWRSYVTLREQRGALAGDPWHNAMLFIWTEDGEPPRENSLHILTCRLPGGDEPPFVLPTKLQKKTSQELLPWMTWRADQQPELQALQRPVTRYVALYVRGEQLCWDASPDYPLCDEAPDVRTLMLPPRRWGELAALPPGEAPRPTLPAPTHPSARPAMPAPSILDQDNVAIGSSTLLPHTFRAMRMPGRWMRPGNGNPPYYEELHEGVAEADRVKVLLHPSDGRSPLTPEQEAAAYEAVLGLDDDKVRAFAIALGSWFAGTGGGDAHMPKVTVTANALLEFQGVKRNKGAYRPAQKEKVANDVWALNSIFIRGPQVVYDARGRRKIVKVRSRLLEVAQEDETNLLGEDTPYAFRIAPGEWIKPLIEEGTRYVAVLLSPVLRYNPRQGVELIAMRIGLHLALHWRFRAAQGNFDQPWNMTTLLESTGIEIPTHREQRRRLIENFERAMDRLREDGVLASWEYVRLVMEVNPTAVFAEWITRTVRVMPPRAVTDQYAGIARRHRLEVAASKRRAPRQTV